MVDDLAVMAPRHVLCVLGNDLDFATVGKIAAEVGGPGFSLDEEYSEREPDPRMRQAFEASAAGVSFTDTDWEAVDDHDSVAYLLSRQRRAFTLPPPLRQPVACEEAQRMLAVTAALLRSDATAVKNESNGLAHSRDRWLSLADRSAAPSSPEELAATLAHAWVKRPISDDTLLYTCGMHLLGAPDVELEADPATAADVEACVDLIDGLVIYLLTDERAANMDDGEGFRLAADAPRWLLHKHPCERYPDDDIFYNPYGYWRLTPA